MTSEGSGSRPKVDSDEVYKHNVKLPPYWPSSLNTWFIQVESQFAINRITSEVTKYNYLVSALPQDVAETLTDILDQPHQTTPFTQLKDAIINRHLLSIERRIKRIISDEDMGDKSPSDFYRRLKQLAGTSGTVTDDLIRKLWLSRLPHLINISLIPLGDQSIDTVLDTADKIYDAMQTSTNVTNISALSNKPSTSSSSVSHNQDIQSLHNEIKELRGMIAKISFTDRNPRSRSRNKEGSNNSNRNRSRSRSRFDSSGSFCWYHFRHGKDAKKCKEPCQYNKPTTSLN